MSQNMSLRSSGANMLGANPALISFDSKPSPRAHKEFDVKEYIETLQQRLKLAKDNLKEYKRQIETYRSEIAAMQRALETLNNDNLKQMVPVVAHDTEYFNQAIGAQRQENIHLQQRLTDLKKDKAAMQGQINIYQLRIAQMESNIGIQVVA